jgi:hypothetical protein
MHAVIGFLILAGAAAFVVFAFGQGMGVRRSGRKDDGQAGDLVRDSQIHQQADGGLRDG